MDSDRETCEICAKKFTECLRKKVTCLHCNYQYCTECFKKYLSMENTTEIDCPKCHVSLSLEFVYENFSRNFIDKDFKKKRQEILLDRERALIPETIQYLDNLVQVKNIKSEIKDHQHSIWVKRQTKDSLNTKYESPCLDCDGTPKIYLCGTGGRRFMMCTCGLKFCYHCYYIDCDLSDESFQEIENHSCDQNDLKVGRKKKFEIRQKIKKAVNTIKTEIRDLEYRLTDSKIKLNQLQSGSNNVRSSFVRSCPREGCRGLLSTKWKCLICHIDVCSRCHEIKLENSHECDENTLKSVNKIALNSKPCPNCASIISRIEGCNHMWCTMCRQFFDWKTLKIINHVVANPHYYEYLRNTGREMGDQPDGYDVLDFDRQGFPIFSRIYRISERFKLPEIDMIYTKIRHIQQAVIGYYHDDPVTDATNRDLRIRYLKNEIDTNRWKSLLQTREKRRDKKQAYYQIYQMLIAVCTDIFNRVVSVKKKSECISLLIELENVRDHFNDSINIIHERYRHTTRQTLDENFDLRIQ